MCDRGQFRVESVDMKDGQRFLQDRPAQSLLDAEDTAPGQRIDRIWVQTKGAGHLAESPLFVVRIPNCLPFLFKQRIPDATGHEPFYDGINKVGAGPTKSILVNPLAAFTIQKLQSAPSKPVVLPSYSSFRIEGHHMNIGKPITFPRRTECMAFHEGQVGVSHPVFGLVKQEPPTGGEPLGKRVEREVDTVSDSMVRRVQNPGQD